MRTIFFKHRVHLRKRHRDCLVFVKSQRRNGARATRQYTSACHVLASFTARSAKHKQRNKKQENPIGTGVAYQRGIDSQSSSLIHKPHLRFTFKYDIQAGNHCIRMPLNERTKLIAIPDPKGLKQH